MELLSVYLTCIVDYQETYTPIAKMNTIRILLSIATIMDKLLK